jgi:hypothetical protein
LQQFQGPAGAHFRQLYQAKLHMVLEIMDMAMIIILMEEIATIMVLALTASVLTNPSFKNSFFKKS